MRRIIPLLLVGAVAAFAVGCRDVVAPGTNSSSDYAATVRGRGTSSSVIGTIEISPNGGTYRIGDFEVVIPAGAVCDPATTSYGRQHWDDDCTPASSSITVKVVAERRRNGVSIDFKPDLRFRPSAGWVTIQTRAYHDLLTSDAVRQLGTNSVGFRALGMVYSRDGSRIDEVLANGDRSLVTHIDRNTGIVWRRIKHFSGYMVNSGFLCVSTDDGGCDGGTGGLGGLPDPTGQSEDPPVAADLVSPESVVVEPVVDPVVDPAVDPGVDP